MPVDHEDDLGPFEPPIKSAERAARTMQADQPNLTAATRNQHFVAPLVYQALTRLAHSTAGKVALKAGWVERNAGNAADMHLRTHFQARGIDVTAEVEDLPTLKTLALSDAVGFDFAEVREADGVVHASMGPEPVGFRLDPLALNQRIPDVDELSAEGVGPLTAPIASDATLVDYAGHKMILEVRQRLQELDYMARTEWPDLKQPAGSLALVVEKAYVDETAVPAGDRTIFGEGRAAEIKVRGDTGNERVGRLARLALNTGFTWVRRLADRVHVSCPQSIGYWVRSGQDVDPARRNLEREVWKRYDARVRTYMSFWKAYLDLRQDGNVTLDAVGEARYVATVRAVSFKETIHGRTDYARDYQHPIRVLLQNAHKDDSYWRLLALIETDPNALRERYRRGGGRSPVEIWKTPALLPREADFPPEVDLIRLFDRRDGRADQNLTPEMSLFWGLGYLIYRINLKVAFDCKDRSWPRMVWGAANYNGFAVAAYQNLISLYLFRYILDGPFLPDKLGADKVAPSLLAGDATGASLRYHGWYKKDEDDYRPRYAKFGGFRPDRGETDPSPRVLFAAAAGASVVAVVAGRAHYDNDRHVLTLTFAIDGADWVFTYDSIKDPPFTGDRDVKMGDPLGKVVDRGKTASGQSRSHVGLALKPVDPGAAVDRIDVMDPVVALDWEGQIKEAPKPKPKKK